MGEVSQATTFGQLVRSGVLAVGDGYRAKIEELGGKGPFFLRAGALTTSGFDWRGLDSFRSDVAPDLASKTGRAGDVVITTKGNSIGRVGWVPSAAPEFVYSPHLSYWRSLDEGALDPRFLYYWARSEALTKQLGQLAFGTDMAPYFSLRDQALLRFDLRPIEEQRATAEVLGALDDKIAADRRTIGSLRGLLGSLVEEALVRASVRAQLGDLAKFHNRRRVPLSSRARSERQGPVPYYGAAGAIDSVNEALFDEVLLLVGEDGTVITDQGTPVIQYVWGPSWVNNHAHVLTGTTLSTETLRYVLGRTSIVEAVTGAVQPKLSMGRLASTVLEVPSDEEVDRIEPMVQAATAQERSLLDQVNLSAALRDTLLPQLMSGAMRVKDAEDVVGEVV